MYSMFLILEIFVYNFMNKIYIELSINKYIYSRQNVDLYWIITNCSIIIVITTMNHIINKIGIYNMIEYKFVFVIG